MFNVPPPFQQSPFRTPFGTPPLASTTGNQVQPQQMVMPETSLTRALNYYADYSGCGFWRMIWPEHVLNAHQKTIVHGSTVMNFDERYFANIKSVRIQRQATEHQREFVKFLRSMADKHSFKIIYEIDDIIFSEDIPEYNKFKPAFTDPKIRQVSQEIMAMCDEITVTCDFMREYYMAKTGNKNITVIPNFPPEFWIGRFYRENLIKDNYRKFCCTKKAKPRILYPGSGAHFDVDNRVGQDDDFAHVRDVIAKTADKYQWVFLGAFPLPLQNLVREGKIEFHPWKRLYEYPSMISDLNANIIVAPLQNNTFNKAKSDLKYIEAGCFGLPAVCQDIDTYNNAPIRFTTGDEMIDQIEKLVNSSTNYYEHSSRARKVAESRFLERDENIDCYNELYNLPYKDSKRVNISRYNK
jgi:glycosyltransferase involved in cell wall biosynthesis